MRDFIFYCSLAVMGLVGVLVCIDSKDYYISLLGTSICSVLVGRWLSDAVKAYRRVNT